ncbi:MAG: MASE1 domain-containing protein [Bacteroidota bacterium]
MEFRWSFSKLVGNNDLRIVVVAGLYLVAAQLGMWLAFPGTTNYPVLPQAGLALALMILLGYRVWPGVLIGSLISYTIVFILQGIEMNISAVLAISAIGIANVLETLLGYKLYQLFMTNGSTPYERTSNTFKFLFITLIAALVGSSVYTISINGMLLSGDLFLSDTFLFNYLAEVSGLWLFTNLILSWAKGKTHWKANWLTALEAVFFTTAIVLILLLMNSQTLSIALERSFPFLIIPFLLWVAFRSSIQAASTAVLVISFYSVYITIQGSGPFVLSDPGSSLLLLQLFVIMIAVTTVILSAAVYERIEARNKLEKFNETLETAVVERTKELDDEIKTRARTEKKIRTSNAELKKTNEELDNFVYKVSHDLRAPISSILGLVNLAKMDKKEANMMECVTEIEKSAKTQDSFIRDIIELTKNARVKPKRQKIDFEKLVDETFDYLKYSTRSKPPKPKLNINQKKVFYSDNSRLKVIFNNVISNSIKYSNPRKTEIEINVEVLNGHAKIDIRDNGKGIEKKYHEDVFNMFFRATDQNAGSGLGLYIVKETVDKLKGQISLESEVNKGTTLHMRLPNMQRRKTSRTTS